MTRLTRYLLRVFSADALALFGVASLLLFLVQCLRSFDVISVKGQDLLTLVGQAVLTMPTVMIAFLHVCVGIGLARALRSLQQSQELHIIHSSRRTGSLFRAIGLYALGGTICVLFLTNILEPSTRKVYNLWSAQIAADLVSRTLTPHRFLEVTPGVTIMLGSRGSEGQLGSFFADDRRTVDIRRTYIAESATVAADADGYVLQLSNGSIQYRSTAGRFSEVSFTRYDLAVDRLTGSGSGVGGVDTVNSIELVANGLASGNLGPAIGQLQNRFGEGFRVIEICLFVAALAAFPSGRRGREFPTEVLVLLAAFVERAVSGNLPSPIPYIANSGSVYLAALSLGIIAWRLRAGISWLSPQKATA